MTKRRTNKEVIDAVTADADDADAWEAVEAPPRQRRRLGTQLSIRLDQDYAERLRAIAEHRNIGYTSLVRSWIEERIDSEMQNTVPPVVRVMASAADSRVMETIQIAGGARLITA